MQTLTVTKWTAVLIGVAISAAVVVGIVAVWRMDLSGDLGSGLPDRYSYKDKNQEPVDAERIGYRRVGSIPLTFDHPKAIATDDADRIYVAGDTSVAVYSAAGERALTFSVGAETSAIAVASAEHTIPNRVYVGAQNEVRLFDPQGKPQGVWTVPGEKTPLVTSIAVDLSDVFVADFGNRVVLHYNPEGELLGTIRQRDKKGNTAPFAIPSPYFDVAVADDEVLRVAHTALGRVDSFDYEGSPLGHWGHPGESAEGFYGCCNPAHFTLLPDHRYVTAEKGLVRVKVYSADGQKLVCMVDEPKNLARPTGTRQVEDMGLATRWVDVAADSRGRVLVLDPVAGRVWIYEAKKETDGDE